MSSELSPFFPSSTHPALPIASSVLSTLRNLTGPGRGNNLRPEERVALVGVSALIACEKVHSKDLVEKTAQKAASVSPAHFRSALRLARELLATQPAESEHSPSPSRRASLTRSKNATASSSSASIAPPSLPSPFATPKKKIKFSSGVDLTGLIKHTPTRGSPLKQSVTPRRRTEGTSGLGDVGDYDDDDDDGREGDEEGDMGMGTPSKVRNVHALPTPTEGSKRKRRNEEEGIDAFFALRPGAGSDSTPVAGEGRFRGFAHDPRAGPSRTIRTEAERKERRVRRKKDWTFREEVWGGKAVERRNEKVLTQVREALAGVAAG